jgi:hypothetical protein
MIERVPIITLLTFGMMEKTAESGITVVFMPLEDKFLAWTTPLKNF